MKKLKSEVLNFQKILLTNKEKEILNDHDMNKMLRYFFNNLNFLIYIKNNLNFISMIKSYFVQLAITLANIVGIMIAIILVYLIGSKGYKY